MELVKMRSYRSWMSPYSNMTNVLMRKGETHKEKTGDNEGRDWSVATVSQGMTSIAGKHQKLDETRKEFPRRFQRQHDTTDTLILDFQPSECEQ